MSRRTLARPVLPQHVPASATRRNLFGSMGALLLLTAAEAGPAKAGELDGELLACCAEALAIEYESNRLYAVCCALQSRSLSSRLADAAYDAHEDATLDTWHELVDRICDLPARTPEGLRQKAAVARSAVPTERRDEPDPVDRLAWSVFGDVLGRAGA